MKIVSLLPSATEIICSIGLGDQLVGVTHECDYPPAVVYLPKVTTTLIPKDATSLEIDGLVRERLETAKALYSLNMEVLNELQPDLIVTQALCDVCAVAEAEVQAAACSLPNFPKVINLEPFSLQDVFDTIELVGNATGQQEAATETLANLQQRCDAVVQRTEEHIPAVERPSVAFLEWIDPPFNAGHWTPELIEMAGGIDCLGSKHQPSRTTPWESLVAKNPQVLFIALCGFDLQRTLADVEIMKTFPGYAGLECVRNRRVYVTDGNAYFSRSGPRLVDSLEIIAHALHPAIHSLPTALTAALIL